jgi:hypothetical protein
MQQIKRKYEHQAKSNQDTSFISSAVEYVLPVWSYAPVRRTYSVLKASEFTQCPWPWVCKEQLPLENEK